MPGEDAFAYRANLEDFRFLKPDAVIFTATAIHRRFGAGRAAAQLTDLRLTGITRSCIRDSREALMMHTCGISKRLRRQQVVFRPAWHNAPAPRRSPAPRTSRTRAERRGSVADTPQATDHAGAVMREVQEFCAAMNTAVTYARSARIADAVVNQPYWTTFQIRIRKRCRRCCASNMVAMPAFDTWTSVTGSIEGQDAPTTACTPPRPATRSWRTAGRGRPVAARSTCIV